MANIFNPPGVGKFSNVFDEPHKGTILITATDSETIEIELIFIIQSFSIQKAERTQEVRTLADTSHLYTFGKELPRMMIDGFFINSTLSPKGDIDQLRHGGISSDDILDLWDNAMRAKTIGTSQVPISVLINPLGNRVFKGVGSNLNISNNIAQEALISASFTLIITEEENLS